ncbi:hypothetical protein [Streptomyces griseorubiginosus]|uniref:hypothetical protein n=1 Tax=Streptomyces griseorubiginosus TaxID=67304 RepID=UPI0036E5861C
MPGGIAARWMGWQRRMGTAAGPLGASGEASTGDAVTVELLVAGEWIDLSAAGYVLVRDDNGQIRITYGTTGGEGSQTERATATLQLKNTDGRFSPRNPSGPYYGLIGRNTPMRISVPDGLGGKSYRIWGEVSNWAGGWSSDGNDVWVDVTVAGPMQRLAQGPAPEHSVIYQAITDPAPTGLVAYWPCEDPSGSMSLASALATGSPMTWIGTPTLASYGGFNASDPLPDLTTATLSGGVPKYDDPTATQVRFLAYIPVTGLSLGKVLVAIDQLDYSAGSSQFWEVFYDTATRSLTIRTCASDGTVLGAELPHDLDVRGRLLYVSVELQESGTGITRALRLKDVNTGVSYAVSDTVALTQLTRVTKVQFGPASRAVSGAAGTANLPGVAVGHATVENAITAIDALGVRLNPIGETAGRRIQRLCGEKGVAFDWVGDLDDTVPLGPQGKANLLSLVQESCLADGGLLYESRAALGLGYRTRTSLYAQDPALILSYPGFNLAETPTPVEDDRLTQNILTVTSGGASATYEQTDGALGTATVGEYGESSGLTLNLADNDQATLLDHAAWRVHLGTVDEERHPQIAVNLAHPSITPDMRRAILALRLGDRIQITSPPTPQCAPDTIDQMLLGIEETITKFQHRLTFTCAPSSPYNGVSYLDAASARIDIDGSQLLSAVSAGATSIDVIPSGTNTMLWTTDTADMPFAVRAGGEVMTVTAVTPNVADTFTRTTANGWGTADTGQTWTLTGGASSEHYTQGSEAAHQLTSINVNRYDTVTAPSADVDLRADFATSAVAAGGSQYTGIVARYVDANNLYYARLTFTTSQQVQVVLQKRVGGVQTDLATVTATELTHAAFSFFTLRFRVIGAVLMAKAWPRGGVEPGSWHATATDSSLSAAGSLGARSILDALNTNVLPVVVSIDNFQLTNVQTMTVTRSVNGVSKAQVAGEDIRLAYPTPVAL